MLNDHPVYKWQRDALVSIDSLNLAKDDAVSILNYMYGTNAGQDYLSPKIDPDKLVFWRQDFSHLTADMFMTNMIPATIEYPQLVGSEELVFSLLIQCKEGFVAFRRDKDAKLADSKTNELAYNSIYGHWSPIKFASLPDVIVITDKTVDDLSGYLGGEFKGAVSSTLEFLERPSDKRIYIDTRYLESKWNSFKDITGFNHSVWSLLAYMHKSNDEARLTMIAHHDVDCVSKFCAYN